MRGARTRVLTVCVAGLLATACGATGGGVGGSEGAGSGDAGSEDAASDAGQGASASDGRVTLRGQAPAASGGVPAIITVRPLPNGTDAMADDAWREVLADHPAAPAAGSDAVVDQFGLAFSPRVLIASEGGAVRFTNSEGAISHNVRLRSVSDDSTVFDDDTGPSEGVDVRLPGPGGYDVLCDMHPGMTGFVFVTDALLAVAADTDGRFEVSGLPLGEYQVRAWTLDGWGTEQVVTIGAEPPFLELPGADSPS